SFFMQGVRFNFTICHIKEYNIYYDNMIQNNIGSFTYEGSRRYSRFVDEKKLVWL
ncbi:HAMP domain protein, partial [Fructobacillus pseudoficulneus]